MNDLSYFPTTSLHFRTIERKPLTISIHRLIHESEPYAVESDQVVNLWRTIAMQMKTHFDQKHAVGDDDDDDPPQEQEQNDDSSCQVSPLMCQNRFKSLLCRHDKQLMDANMTYAIVSKHLSLEEQHLQKLLSQISNRMHRFSVNDTSNSNSNLTLAPNPKKNKRKTSTSMVVPTNTNDPPASTDLEAVTKDNWKMVVDMDELDREVDPAQIQQLSEHLEGLVEALRAYISMKKINDYPVSSSSSLVSAEEEEDLVVDSMEQDQEITLEEHNDSHHFTIEAMESAEKMCNDLLRH